MVGLFWLQTTHITSAPSFSEKPHLGQRSSEDEEVFGATPGGVCSPHQAPQSAVCPCWCRHGDVIGSHPPQTASLSAAQELMGSPAVECTPRCHPSMEQLARGQPAVGSGRATRAKSCWAWRALRAHADLLCPIGTKRLQRALKQLGRGLIWGPLQTILVGEACGMGISTTPTMCFSQPSSCSA